MAAVTSRCGASSTSPRWQGLERVELDPTPASVDALRGFMVSVGLVSPSLQVTAWAVEEGLNTARDRGAMTTPADPAGVDQLRGPDLPRVPDLTSGPDLPSGPDLTSGPDLACASERAGAGPVLELGSTPDPVVLEERLLFDVARGAGRVAAMAMSAQVRAVTAVYRRRLAEAERAAELDGRSLRSQERDDEQRWVAVEAAQACGVSEYVMGSRLEAGLALQTKLPDVGEAFAAGLLEWWQVRAFVDAVAVLDSEQAQQVSDLVLPRVSMLSGGRFRRALLDAVTVVQGPQVEQAATGTGAASCCLSGGGRQHGGSDRGVAGRGRGDDRERPVPDRRHGRCATSSRGATAFERAVVARRRCRRA